MRIVFAILAVSLVTQAPALAAPTDPPPVPPASGVYEIFSPLYTSNPSGCKSGPYLPFRGNVVLLYYPGPSENGAIIRTGALESSDGSIVVHRIYLPTTPAAGVTSWSGAIKMTFTPAQPSANFNGTFSATLTFVDEATFLASMTFVIGRCTFTF